MGGINTDYSRRTMPNLCAYWKRDESGVGNSDVLIYSQNPAGYFYARAITVERDNTSTIQDAFMADSHTVTIESNDDLDDIGVNDLVRYKGKIWRVDMSPQRVLRENKNMLSDVEEYKYILSLRR